MRQTRPLPQDPPHPASHPVRLRPATPGDIAAIAAIWHAGWRDAHLGNVPDELVEHRTRSALTRLAEQRVADTVVAVDGDRVLGFVTIHDDELEQLYVAADVRRRGVATALIARGEAAIAARFDTAWLAVVAGNTTARRFYLRLGWHDAGPFDNPAPTANGPLPVPALRYTKGVRARANETAS